MYSFPILELVYCPKKQEQHRIDNLSLNLKQLGKRVQSPLKVIRRKEIMKTRAEKNEKESKKQQLRLIKLFQKISEQGTFPNSFYEITITLMPKPGKDNTHTHRKLQVNITHEHKCKIFSKILANRIKNTFKITYTMVKLGLLQGYKYSIYTNQSMWYITLTNW